MKNLHALLLLGLSFAFVLPVYRRKETTAAKLRPPMHAGQFYPGTREGLSKEIRGFLKQAVETRVVGDIVAIWVPHAGYMYSGQVAAHAYRSVEGKSYDAVVLVGPSHYVDLDAAALGDFDAFRTPLGDARVDTSLNQILASHAPFITTVPQAHTQEHSLEVQVPFIQTVLPDVPIIPMVIGEVSHDRAQAVARAIAAACKGKKVLLVASSDMSHFPNDADARRVDGTVLETVEAYDTRRVLDLNRIFAAQRIPNLACAMCGSSALATVMLASREMGANSVCVLPYANSSDVSDDRSRVVGYGAAVFYKIGKPVEPPNSEKSKSGVLEDIPWTKEEKATLFSIARESILAALKGQAPPPAGTLTDHLRIKRGVFVTLMNRGRLRGCIGNFGQEQSIAEMVQQMAAAAATQDYRFVADPVTLSEMERIDIKVSILSDLKKIDSIDEIQIGRHGIWIKQGRNSGTYLPEVATELGWNREEFLSHCCAEKAGLHWDAWKKGADIYIYSSQVLTEK
jgi:hypothetical protein